MAKADTSANRFSGLKPAELTDNEKQSLTALAIKVLATEHRVGRPMGSSAKTRSYLRLRMAHYQNEVFGCLYLDTKHRMLALRELFHGTINRTSIYPRVVVQQAMEVNAGAVILFHNHPSGVADPSDTDMQITRQLKEALALVDVRVVDHFVVSANESVSFVERGLL